MLRRVSGTGVGVVLITTVVVAEGLTGPGISTLTPWMETALPDHGTSAIAVTSLEALPLCSQQRAPLTQATAGPAPLNLVPERELGVEQSHWLPCGRNRVGH